MLGRDGHILPCSQGDALITGLQPPQPVSHLGGTKALITLSRYWSYSQSSLTELAPSCEERKAPCPKTGLVRARVPNVISKKKNKVIAPYTRGIKLFKTEADFFYMVKGGLAKSLVPEPRGRAQEP